MGRQRNKVPSYLHHRPSGQARVRINGRDIYLGRYGSKESKEKYARLIAEHFGNGNCETISILNGEELSVAALVVKYDDYALDYYRKNEMPTSQVDRIRVAMRQLVKLYGGIPASDFSPKKLKVVRQAIIKGGSQKKVKGGKRQGTPLSRKYVNSLTSCIKRMFKWAVSEELVADSVFHSLEAVENLKKGRAEGVHEPNRVKPVPDEHIPPVLEQVPRQIRAMIEVQLLTGMRPDEVTIMRGCDIERNDDPWEYLPSAHKTEHREIEKAIFIGPKAQKILLPWLERDDAAFLFSPKEAMDEFNAKRRKNRKTPMTPSQARRKPKKKPLKTPRGHYDDTSYRQAVERGCKKAGVPKWTPGKLRHNTATKISAARDLQAAMLVLGHQEISTTQIYAERNERRYRDIMRKFG